MTYKHTTCACFTGFVVQAIINNFVPLLFVTFRQSYGLTLEMISLLITVNFAVQLTVDLLSARFVDKIGYRLSAVCAHICAAAGLVGLVLLPLILPPFAGLLIAVCIYAVGGGIIEVLVSPIVEAIPSENKRGAMGLLHSFYCWGHVFVVLLSTGYFLLFGTENWQYLALFWAIIPAINSILFAKVPINTLISDGEKGLTIGALFKKKIFWVLFLLMLCAGACELSVSQWASAFAESGLGVSKTLGDLAGPLTFAALMGLSRVLYAKWSAELNLERYMFGCGLLCVASYLLISLSPWPVLSLIGCGLCGLSVGVLWPGTFSLAAGIPKGGTSLYALLALAGDMGCSGGPTCVGVISGLFNDNLKTGILAGVVFPLLLLIGIILWNRTKNSAKEVNK